MVPAVAYILEGINGGHQGVSDEDLIVSEVKVVGEELEVYLYFHLLYERACIVLDSIILYDLLVLVLQGRTC